MSKRTMAADEVISAITETLLRAEGKTIEQIAKQVDLTGITYIGDSLFEAEEN